MKCKYFKTRTKMINKKKRVYNYCTLLKKEVPFSCYQDCDNKEYRVYKPIKKRTYKQAKNEKERFSIIYKDLTKCCICGSKYMVSKNEVFDGAYRQRSIKYGMVAPMCEKKTCHKRFHRDYKFALKYKVMFQKEFMKNHSLDEFIDIFGQDYIYVWKKLNKMIE